MKCCPPRAQLTFVCLPSSVAMAASPDAEVALVTSLESEADPPSQTRAQRFAVRARPLLGLVALIAMAFTLGWHGGKGHAMRTAKTQNKTVLFLQWPGMENITNTLTGVADHVDSVIGSATNALMEVRSTNITDLHGSARDAAAAQLEHAQNALERLHEDYHSNGHLQHAENAIHQARNALHNVNLQEHVGDYLDEATSALNDVHDDARTAVDCATRCDHENYGEDASCEGGFGQCSSSCSWMNVFSCNARCLSEKISCIQTAAGHSRVCLSGCLR